MACATTVRGRAGTIPARARERDTRTPSSGPGAGRLALFDIDGTLIRLQPRGDDTPYRIAFEDAFGISISMDWSGYRNATDSGILREVLERKFGRSPSGAEMNAVKARFLDLVRQACARESGLFVARPGAAGVLRDLLGTGRWAVAIATGNWEASALLKLEGAGIDHDRVPLASADDSEVRSEIVEAGVKKAAVHYARGDFSSVVYIGDRAWDLEAARKLGFGFIGIGESNDARLLREAGHTGVILPDLDSAALLRVLDGIAAG